MESISPMNIRQMERAHQHQHHAKKLNTEVHLSSDDEEGLKIEGQSTVPASELNGIKDLVINEQGNKSRQHLVKIDSRKIMNDKTVSQLKKSFLDRKRSTNVSALPTMNKNTSIQNLNNLDIETDQNQQIEDTSIILNNRSTTPAMHKGHGGYLGRNKSVAKVGELSQISIASTAKAMRFAEDVKVKLAYEWKNVYRNLVQADTERRGSVPITTFNKIIHQQKVFLSREELRKLE